MNTQNKTSEQLGFVGSVQSKPYASTIQRIGDDVIVVGSTLSRAPAFHQVTCGCGRQMMVVTTLPKASAEKFDTCTPCFNKVRYAKYQDKLQKQFADAPQEVKDAWAKASAAAVALSESRRGGK